jgi:hypothetical protein
VDVYITTPVFVKTMEEKTGPMKRQQGTDLGTRLQAAFSSALRAALHSGFRRDFQSFGSF